VLKNIKSKKNIGDKILQYLMANDPRLGRFYLLPQIHKRLHSVSGRPVISNCGYNSYLTARKVKPYIKDTNDFLCKLRGLPSIPNNF